MTSAWKPFPDSPGDWIAVQAWACGCCVVDVVMAWVLSDDPNDMELETKHDEIVNGFRILWHSLKPEHFYPNAWMKVTLPNMIEMSDLESAVAAKK